MQVLKGELKLRGIDSVYTEVVPDKMYSMEIFAETKADSKIIKDNLDSFRYCKYHIIEAH